MKRVNVAKLPFIGIRFTAGPNGMEKISTYRCECGKGNVYYIEKMNSDIGVEKFEQECPYCTDVKYYYNEKESEVRTND